MEATRLGVIDLTRRPFDTETEPKELGMLFLVDGSGVGKTSVLCACQANYSFCCSTYLLNRTT